MTAFTILLGGALSVTPRLVAQVKGTRIIAADGGMSHAERLGVTPELWVGDFDSTPDALAARFATVPRRRFDPAKAKSDGELAVEAALEAGATALVLAGALGGDRSDHQMIILTQALALAARGLALLLTSGHEEASPVLPGMIRADLPAGTLFSLVPFGDLAGLTISGARWPLMRADVPFGSTLTLSNVAEGPVELSLVSGRAMLFANLALPAAASAERNPA
ncbi:MAG: thiamine diphosphokinase [Rhizobiaceae bacterium]|jgi:thiamine pyrophosphokinase|nr:thiamine diphosphokinase [Rhizobiaceae bacterium]